MTTLTAEQMAQALRKLQTSSEYVTRYGNVTREPGLLGGPLYGAKGIPSGQAGVMGAYKFTDRNMYRMLASRMGWDLDEGTTAPLEFCTPKKLSDEQAVVFVIHNQTALTIYDDINLFPSDALVSSLRLLLS